MHTDLGSSVDKFFLAVSEGDSDFSVWFDFGDHAHTEFTVVDDIVKLESLTNRIGLGILWVFAHDRILPFRRRPEFDRFFLHS